MGSTHNRVSGDAGAVVQARDISGEITIVTSGQTTSDGDSHTTTDTSTHSVTFHGNNVNYHVGDHDGGMHQ